MARRDWIAILIIGAGVGLLIQPVVATVAVSQKISLSVLDRAGIFLFFTILAPVALFILHLIGKKIPVIFQFGKFAAVGVLNTFVDVGVLGLEILLLGTPGAWAYRIFKSVSFLAATTNSFLWNKFWTFESHETVNPKQTVKFYFVAFVGFLLNVGLASYVFSNLTRPASIGTNSWAYVGAFAGIVASFMWDFLGYKFWVFKKPAVQPTTSAAQA